MPVFRERPDEQRARGINVPLSVSVAGGPPVSAVQWSHRGVVLAAADVAADGPVDLRLLLDVNGFTIGVPVEAAPRTGPGQEASTPEGCVRLDFVGFDQRDTELLGQYIQSRMRGGAAGADERVPHSDTPQDPPSATPDTGAAAQCRRRSRMWPAVLTAFYLTLGTVVLGFTALVIYANCVEAGVRTAGSGQLDVLAAAGIPVEAGSGTGVPG